MKYILLGTTVLLSMTLAACGNETASCSDPNVKAKLIEITKNYMAGQANQTMNIMLAMVSKGEMSLEAIRTDSKTDTLTTCSADLHVVVDPNFVKETQGAVKAEPILPTQYTVQRTDDGKGTYIKLLNINL